MRNTQQQTPDPLPNLRNQPTTIMEDDTTAKDMQRIQQILERGRDWKQEKEKYKPGTHVIVYDKKLSKERFDPRIKIGYGTLKKVRANGQCEVEWKTLEGQEQHTSTFPWWRLDITP